MCSASRSSTLLYSGPFQKWGVGGVCLRALLFSAEPASRRNWLETQELGPHPGPPEPESAFTTVPVIVTHLQV